MIVAILALAAIALYLSAAGVLARPLMTGGQPLARIGMTMARETSTTMDVIEHAKDAFMGLQGAPDPVRWPAVPDDAR